MEKKYSPQGQYSPSQSLLNQLLSKQHRSQDYQIQHPIQGSFLDKQHLHPQSHLNVRINSPVHSNAKTTAGPLLQNDCLIPAHELNQRSNFQKCDHDISKEKIIQVSSSQTAFPLQQINSSFTAPKNSPPKYSNKFSNQPLSLPKNNYLNPSAGNISQPNLAGTSSTYNTPALGLISQQQHLAVLREQQMLNHSISVSTQNKISPKTNNPSIELGNYENNVYYLNLNKDIKNDLNLTKAPNLNSPSQQLPSALDKKTHLLNLEKIRNNLNNKLLLKATIEDPKSSSLHSNSMKVKSITPSNTSKPQMFECAKKPTTQQQPAQENLSLNYGQSQDKHRRSPPNKPKPLEIGSELDERSSCNGGNSLTFDETQKNGHALEEISKRSYYQIEQNPKVKLMMFDKLKKRKKKNSSSAKGNDNTKQKQNGHSFNISYSKSSQPSNVSTRAQQQISKSTTNKGISESRVTPQSTSTNGTNGQVTQFFSSPNNLANLQKAATQFATSKHQLSKTLSFTFKQGNPLLNSDPITPQQAQWQENMTKINHSPSAVIYIPPQVPIIVEQKGANQQAVKHRKVVSLSSSSPKFTKEAMQQNCQLVGSNLSIDFKKLLSAQNRSILPNNRQKKVNNKSEIKNCYASSPLVFQKDGEKQFSKVPGLSAGNSQCFGIKKVSDIEGSKIQGGIQSANSSQNLQDAPVLEGVIPYNNSAKEKSKTFLSKITGNIPNIKSGIDNKKDSAKNQKNQSLMVVTNHLEKQEKSIQSRLGGAAGEPSAFFQSSGDFVVNNIKQQKSQDVEGSNPNQINNQTTNTSGGFMSQVQKQVQPQNLHKQEGSGLPVQEQVVKILQEKIKLSEDNQRINAQFDLILKSRIDEGSYYGIMETFGMLVSSDIYFQSSLQKFKVCLDSLLHCINSKSKDAHLESQQPPVSVDDTPENEGKKKSNSAISSLNNTNQSKSPFMKGIIPTNQQFLIIGNINDTNGQHLNNSSFSVIQNNNYPSQQQTPLSFASTSKSPNITKVEQRRKEDNNCPKQLICQSKQTQTEGLTQNIQISKSEEDVASKENVVLREFVVEQEGKLAAYKAKEASMIKLLLAVKDRGINIDEIYENDVISQNQHVSKPKQNIKQDDEDEDCDDDESAQPNNIQGNSRFLDDIAKGIIHGHNDLSQSQGFADESIVNDSDESSFNYYGKAQSDDEDSINSSGQHHPLHKEYQQQHSNMNSGRSKFEDDMKLKLRLDLSDLKKVNTQLNDEIVPPNNGQEQVLKDSTNPQYLNNGNSLSATDNKNIFIDQAYIDSNSENKHNPANNQSNIVKGQHLPEQQVIKAHKNSYKKQEQQILEKTTPMQEYLIHPQTKLSQEEIAQYIQKNDFETHQIDQHFQNNFDFEEEHENNILLGCNDQVSHERINHPPQKLVDKGYLTGQQLQQQEIDNHANVGQIWTNEKKRLSF